VDRGQDIARLGVSAQVRARAEGERLRALARRGLGGEQYQPGVRILLAELADLRQVGQGINVEDCYARALNTQDHPDAMQLDVLGDDLEAGVALDHAAQAAGEEVVKAGDDDGD
jgi:hypothetical protein